MTAELRLVYVGHATVLVELDGVRLLTDPVLRRRVAHLRRRGSPDPHASAGVGVVLLPHVHYDHLHVGSLRLLPPDLTVVAPRGARRILRRFADVKEPPCGRASRPRWRSECSTPAPRRS